MRLFTFVMPSLRNQKHEAFCRNVCKLNSDLVAYQKAYKCSRAAAIKNAWTLRENKGIVARIAELQQKSETKSTLTMQERREWLARSLRANPKDLDLDKDGDLLEEYTKGGDGMERIKLAGKVSVLMADAKLAGELIDRQDLTSNDEALPSVVPAITINIPTSFAQRRGK